MFAVIFIPNFSLQAVLRREPGLSSQPLVLLDPDSPKPSVIQLTPAARACGVSEGQTTSQATARCGSLRIKTRSLAQETIAAQLLLQTAFAFSPRVESTGPGICTLDLQGLPAVWRRPKQEWTSKILNRLSQLHLSAQLGIAATPTLALLAARQAKPVLILDDTAISQAIKHVSLPTTALPAASEADPLLDAVRFVSRLPIAALDPDPETTKVLGLWGVRTAGQFLALGKEQIANRLGPAALELFTRAAPESVHPLKLATPPEEFVEFIEFENEIETLEPLLFVLRQLVEQLSARLGSIGLVTGEFQFELGVASGAHHRDSFKIPVPTGNVETLCRMLGTRLETLRTEAPITSLRLKATPARSDSHQLGLFVTTLVNPNQFAETLGRLSALCNPDQVGIPVPTPGHRPDAFTMKSPELGGGANEPLASRGDQENAPGLQLRRLRPPLTATIEFHKDRPARFRSSSYGGVITDARGPFISSGNWWEEGAWARSEWDVQTADGALYRLFYASDGHFVEGIYD